jgi:hypothetical protein
MANFMCSCNPKNMKLIFLSFFLFIQSGVRAVEFNGRAVQAIVRPADQSQILTNYYQLKDALAAGDAAAAAAAAGEMLKAINGADMKSMTAADHTAFMSLQDKLAYDARHISESKDINHQREHFVSLSANLFKLAKQVSLSSQPIFEDYCPMKKAYWLSGDAAIKNPYFGSGMPDCGKVAATIQPK